MYIDIHNHSLYGVDDGSESMEESVQMLEDAKKQGATAIVLTPHYRHGMFGYPKEAILSHYEKMKKEADRFEIRLYLGCEYHVGSDILEHLSNGRVLPMAETEYVLTEYSGETPYSLIAEYTRKLLANGYRPIIAHAERYRCLFEDMEKCLELKHMGAMVQINADSVLGIDGRKVAKVCKKAIKMGAIDIIASDAHGITERQNHMGDCCRYVAKKFGEDAAEHLFYINPGKILEQERANTESQ